MVLAMAEIFALLLGEIDLSIGYVGAVGAVHRRAARAADHHRTGRGGRRSSSALLTCALHRRRLQGTLITRLRLPSFIVTLAGLLIFNGVLLIILGLRPLLRIPEPQRASRRTCARSTTSCGAREPLAGWIVMAVVVGALSLGLWLRDTRRRRSGLVAPPVGLTFIKIVLMAAIGIAVVAICNVNRAAIGTLERGARGRSSSSSLLPRVATADAVDVAICPSFLALGAMVDSTRGSRVEVYAQNMHQAPPGRSPARSRRRC